MLTVKKFFACCLSFYGLFLAALLYIASRLFAYSLFVCFGVTAPWYANLLGGLILNGVNLPLAVICWILTLAGVHTPLFGGK